MKQPEKNKVRETYGLVLLTTGLTGCVTFLILGVLILLGLYLDKTFGSAKHLFTFGLIILSVPLNVAGLYGVVRFIKRRNLANKEEDATKSLQEDVDSVGN